MVRCDDWGRKYEKKDKTPQKLRGGRGESAWSSIHLTRTEGDANLEKVNGGQRPRRMRWLQAERRRLSAARRVSSTWMTSLKKFKRFLRRLAVCQVKCCLWRQRAGRGESPGCRQAHSFILSTHSGHKAALKRKRTGSTRSYTR